MIREIERLYTPRSRPEMRCLSPLTRDGWTSFFSGNFTARQALAIFTLNLNAHPRSAGACDSLAEAYRRSGQTNRAIELYRKALEIDPSFSHAAEILKKLGAAGP